MRDAVTIRFGSAAELPTSMRRSHDREQLRYADNAEERVDRSDFQPDCWRASAIMAALALGRSSRSRSSCVSNDVARTRTPGVWSWPSHSLRLGRAVYGWTWCQNRACTVERFDAQHDSCCVRDEAVGVAHQLLEREHARRAVIDRP